MGMDKFQNSLRRKTNKNLESLLKVCESCEQYEKAAKIKKELERRIENSELKLTEDGLKLIPKKQEVVEFRIIGIGIVGNMNIEDANAEAISMTKAVLAIEFNVDLESVTYQLNYTR